MGGIFIFPFSERKGNISRNPPAPVSLTYDTTLQNHIKRELFNLSSGAQNLSDFFFSLSSALCPSMNGDAFCTFNFSLFFVLFCLSCCGVSNTLSTTPT